MEMNVVLCLDDIQGHREPPKLPGESGGITMHWDKQETEELMSSFLPVFTQGI